MDLDARLRRHEDRTPTHGYAESRGPTMTPFAKSWRREWNEDAPPSGKRAAGLTPYRNMRV
jgi:hypothetical protein